MHLGRSFAVVALVLTVTAPIAAAKPKPKLTPQTAAEKAASKKFRAAMQRGRVATDKKDYPTAIAAFTEALSILKDDPRALGERGYARLLAKDYDAAEKDLLAAQKRAAGATIQGTIWFNLGLLAEARKDTAAATHAFTESNRLHPTKAAARKLADAAGCGATVDRVPEAGTTYTGWVAAYKGLAAAADFKPDGAPPASEADARKLLCGEDACKDKGPWVVATADGDDLDFSDVSYHLVFPIPGGKLVGFANLGTRMAGRCASTDDVAVIEGDPVQVHVTSEPNDMVYVDTSSDEIKECKSDHCSTACFYVDKTDRDLFFDAATGTQLLEIERPWTPDASEYKLDEDFTQPVALERGKDGVVLKGGRCDQTIPFKAK